MPELNHSDAPLPFPILIGDIGGTNARFSILADANSEQEHFPVVQTANFETIDDAIRLILEKSKVQPRAAILAMAGPVQGDEIPLTNCDWVIRPKTMIANLGIEDVLVWERRFKKLPNSCCVAMLSGWAKHVGDAAKYTGKDASGATIPDSNSSRPARPNQV